MNKLHLDYHRNTKPPMAGAILLLISIAAAMLAWGQYHRLTSGIDAWEDSRKKLEKVSGKQAQGNAQDARGPFQDMKQANEVLRQIALPWEKLFLAVESSTDPEVTLLSMEPDVEKHTVNIGCEAKDIGAMLNFIKRLKERQELGSVYLQSHRVQEHDPEKPVRFSLIALWRTSL